MRVISGNYAGRTGTVDANVFQRPVDYPDEFAAGFHLVLDDGKWVTVRRDQVASSRAGTVCSERGVRQGWLKER